MCFVLLFCCLSTPGPASPRRRLDNFNFFPPVSPGFWLAFQHVFGSVQWNAFYLSPSSSTSSYATSFLFHSKRLTMICFTRNLHVYEHDYFNNDLLDQYPFLFLLRFSTRPWGDRRGVAQIHLITCKVDLKSRRQFYKSR